MRSKGPTKSDKAGDFTLHIAGNKKAGDFTLLGAKQLWKRGISPCFFCILFTECSIIKDETKEGEYFNEYFVFWDKELRQGVF